MNYQKLIETNHYQMIVNNWVTSLSVVPPWSLMTRQDRTNYLRYLISELLDKSIIYILFDITRKKDKAVGWVVFQIIDELPVIHYMYIKHQYRGQGLGSNLLSILLPRHFHLGIDPIYASFPGPFLYPISGEDNVQVRYRGRVDKYNIKVRPFLAKDIIDNRLPQDWSST